MEFHQSFPHPNPTERTVSQFTSHSPSTHPHTNTLIWRWACYIAFLCSPPLPFSSGCMSHFAKTWVSLQTTTYISKSTEYFDILLLHVLCCEEVLHAPTVQIWAQNSTILTPNNLLIVCHSSITNWSQNTFFRNGGNFPISGCYTSTLTLNSERVFCDQFVMEEWQTIRRLFGVKMVEFWAEIWTVGAWRTSSQVSSNNIAIYLVLFLI